MWRTLLLAVAILGGSGISQAVGAPVSVRFGALYWIDAQGARRGWRPGGCGCRWGPRATCWA
ncbi:hypothetical protein ACFQDE_08325 [Deinococcus caeni]|uniref:hypothetical protein n=1 Tax=Deinococcus caeni TaxID=569127 RepID=UPI00361BEBBB